MRLIFGQGLRCVSTESGPNQCEYLLPQPSYATQSGVTTYRSSSISVCVSTDQRSPEGSSLLLISLFILISIS